jgi:hypothetical protein
VARRLADHDAGLPTTEVLAVGRITSLATSAHRRVTGRLP